MALTEQRRNEVAFSMMLLVLQKEGLSSLRPNEIDRKLGSIRAELEKSLGIIDISKEELKEFVKEVLMVLISRI